MQKYDIDNILYHKKITIKKVLENNMRAYPTGSYYWKREPGWTNLRGMWGKRASHDLPLDEEHGNRPLQQLA